MKIFLITATNLKKFTTNCRQFVTKYPIMSQIFPATILMGAGDLAGQILIEKRTIFSKSKGELEEKAKKIDIKRTIMYASIGITAGPILRYWYGKLDNFVQGYNLGKIQKLLLKVTLDQLCFAPIFIWYFMLVLRTVQGMPPSVAFEKTKNEYFSILKANYCFWPAAQLINFYFIPLNLQVTYAQFVAMVWNTYLSWRLAP